MTDLTSIGPEKSLRSRIKHYRTRAHEIEQCLRRHPMEWGRFQSEFNQEINGIFRDLMMFEKDSLIRGEEEKVYKLKRLFIEHFRNEFVVGTYLKRSLEKPRGYPGDYKIIDDIYQNSPVSRGFERLFDNYFQMSMICNAVRNRKEDFKRIICDVITKKRDQTVTIMDLASGPCRDVAEILSNTTPADEKRIFFDCCESDDQAIQYSKEVVSHDPRVRFFKENAVRIALKKDILQSIKSRYDMIYSTGLFDYLDYRVSVRLISNLTKMLKPHGILAISDVRDKFSNPSLYFMEWVADWNLVYRTDDEFRTVFVESGFLDDDLTPQYEQQGIMQYIIAKRGDGQPGWLSGPD